MSQHLLSAVPAPHLTAGTSMCWESLSPFCQRAHGGPAQRAEGLSPALWSEEGEYLTHTGVFLGGLWAPGMGGPLPVCWQEWFAEPGGSILVACWLVMGCWVGPLT